MPTITDAYRAFQQEVLGSLFLRFHLHLHAIEVSSTRRRQKSMATLTPEEIYTRYIRNLSLEERVRLIEQITRDLRTELAQDTRTRDWRELAGLLPYPAFGEDAQDYISRSRREADLSREP